MTADPTSLDRLHDIIVPPPAPWWPPAPGWYWVIGCLLAIAAYAIVRGFVSWQHNRYRREALAEWRRIKSQLADAKTRSTAVTELAILLKRAAITAFPRMQVASLTGRPWLAFLDRTAAMREFDSDTGALLERATYGSISPADIDLKRAEHLANSVRRWLMHHHAGDVA